MKKLIEKLKSWPLWLAMAALVIFCLKEFVGIDIADKVNGFMNVLLPVLIAFGIVNNPNDRANF